jgi:sarcosine oxidase
MTDLDVIVLGRGMIGAPCARHLAEASHRIALVGPDEPADRRRWAGPFGSHHDAARITRRVASDPDWALLAARSIARYRDLEARSGRALFHEAGALMHGPTERPLAGTTAAFARIAGALEGVTLADAPPADLPILRLPPGRVAHEPRLAGWIAPRAMRDAQAELAARAGARIVRQAAVAIEDGRVTLADGTRLSAAQVVVATGPHAGTDRLLPERPAMTVWARTVAFARLSEAEAERLADMPSLIWVPEGWDHDLYMLPPVRYPDGRTYLKIGGQKDGPRLGDEAQMRAWFHGAGDAQVGARLLAELRRVLPGVRVEATHTAPCAVVWTPTGLPYLARRDARTVWAMGGNGAAAKCGDELGRLAALLATGGDLAGEGYRAPFAAAAAPWPAAP